MQIAGILSRSRAQNLAAASFFTNYHPILSRSLGSSRAPHLVSPSPLESTISNIFRPTSGCERAYHDGRPRGSLWRGKKHIGKEALFVILGMKRFKDDGEKLDKFIKTHVLRLLKLDMVVVLNELERQGEVSLVVKFPPFPPENANRRHTFKIQSSISRRRILLHQLPPHFVEIPRQLQSPSSSFAISTSINHQQYLPADIGMRTGLPRRQAERLVVEGQETNWKRGAVCYIRHEVIQRRWREAR